MTGSQRWLASTRSATGLGPRYRARRQAMQQTAQVSSPMSMSQRLRLAMKGSLARMGVTGSLLGGVGAGSGLAGLDEAEGEQPGRLAVVAGAVGFDEAAVGGLTAAVLLELALELFQRGTPHAVHLLSWVVVGGGGRVRPRCGVRVRAHPPGPWVGHAGGVVGVGWTLTAQPGQGDREVLAAHRGWSLSGRWCWPGSVSSRAQGGHSQTTTSALGCWRVGPTWASTSAEDAVGLLHSGQ